MTMDILLTGAVSIVSAMIGGGISYLAQLRRIIEKTPARISKPFSAPMLSLLLS